MSKKSSNPDTLFILDFLGKQTDLKVVLDTVSKWLEGLIPGIWVTTGNSIFKVFMQQNQLRIMLI